MKLLRISYLIFYSKTHSNISVLLKILTSINNYTYLNSTVITLSETFTFCHSNNFSACASWSGSLGGLGGGTTRRRDCRTVQEFKLEIGSNEHADNGDHHEMVDAITRGDLRVTLDWLTTHGLGFIRLIVLLVFHSLQFLLEAIFLCHGLTDLAFYVLLRGWGRSSASCVLLKSLVLIRNLTLFLNFLADYCEFFLVASLMLEHVHSATLVI